MADEILKIDANSKNVSGAVTDDASGEIRMLRIDDTTKGLKVMLVGGAGSGTVTEINGGTGILLTPDPIETTGSVALATNIAPIATLGTAGQSIRVNAGATALEYYTPTAGGITIGTTTITSGTDKGILYNNAGVAGEYTPAASLILATDASKNVQGLDTATYPSLTELTYLKGVTSAIQTQLNGKQASGTYLTPTTGITVDQSTPQSLGDTTERATKLWATDIESTNMPTVGGTAILTSLTAPQFTTIELGHASENTLSAASGILSIESVAIPTISNTATLTNKRIQPRSSTAASGDITPALATANIWQRTALSDTCVIGAPTGTPVLGEVLVFMLKDNGTPRTLTWNAAFTTVPMSAALPTATTISKQLLVTCQFDGTNWLCLYSQQT